MLFLKGLKNMIYIESRTLQADAKASVFNTFKLKVFAYNSLSLKLPTIIVTARKTNCMLILGYIPPHQKNKLCLQWFNKCTLSLVPVSDCQKTGHVRMY